MTGFYRVCVPIAAADIAINGSVGQMSNLGTVCALVSGDYYMQRLGLSSANAMHIVTINRAAGLAWIKDDADSDDIFDPKRTVGTWWESGMGIFLQSALMYGPTFYEKIPLANIFGQLPIVGGVVDGLSMNGPRFFSFYREGLSKPEWLWGAGALGFAKGLGFNTAMGMGQSMAVSTVTKGPWFVDTSSDYVASNVFRYGLNGVVCNAPGQTLNRILERDTPDADLRSTMRQLYERTVGIATQYIAAQPFDIFGGKGEADKKEKRLLGEAVNGNLASRREAWNVFARRYAYDILLQFPEDGERAFRTHHGPTFKLLQLKTWYAEQWTEEDKEDVHIGTFVALARDHPEQLEKLLEEVELQMSDRKAVWRERAGSIEGQANAKALHHFSLMAKFFAYKAKNGQSEYLPFQRFIERSAYREYWSVIPEARTEADMEDLMIYIEDTDHVYTADGQNLNLQELQFGYIK